LSVETHLTLEKAFGLRSFTFSKAEKALRKAGIETGSVKELLLILQKTWSRSCREVSSTELNIVALDSPSLI